MGRELNQEIVTCSVVGEVQMEDVIVVYLKLGYCTALSFFVKITRTQSVHPIVPEESRNEYFEEHYR